MESFAMTSNLVFKVTVLFKGE